MRLARSIPTGPIALTETWEDSPIFRANCRDCTFCDGLRDLDADEKRDEKRDPVATTGGELQREEPVVASGGRFIFEHTSVC